MFANDVADEHQRRFTGPNDQPGDKRCPVCRLRVNIRRLHGMAEELHSGAPIRRPRIVDQDRTGRFRDQDDLRYGAEEKFVQAN